jgi:hypothetical protein
MMNSHARQRIPPTVCHQPTISWPTGFCLFPPALLTAILLLAALPACAQPSGGSNGPMHRTYEQLAGAKHVFYVAPDGKADAAGTEQAPLASLADAAAKARAGDVIKMAPGTYRHSQTIRLEASGSEQQPIRVEGQGPQRPVLDFSKQTEDRTSNPGVELTGSYWQLVGIEITHAGSYGVLITGSHNLLERCAAHENRCSGVQIFTHGSYNLILNCESYRNFDPKTRGEDSDGFTAKHDIGPGNVFRNCRAWQNSDDGWDLWMSPEPVVIEDCLSFRNGYNIWHIEDFQGDGNGFKFGGNYVAAPHVIRRCVSIENPLNGFDQNHNAGGLTVEDCVAIRCGKGFSFPETPRQGQNVLRRNTSFGCQNVLERHLISESNQWYPDIAAGNLGPPPKAGHREVPGAGPVPTAREEPLVTPAPVELAPPPEPQKPGKIQKP